MWYLLIIIIAGAGLLLGITSCKSCNSVKYLGYDGRQPHDSIKGEYTRTEMTQMLSDLADKPVPEKLNPGAMCYAASVMNDTAEFVCPVCGEKTIYTLDLGYAIKHDIPAAERQIAELKSETFSLDETQYCKKCSPDVDYPQLCLIVKYSDEKETHKSCPLTSGDLTMLINFLQGKTIYHTFNDEEVPLKDQTNMLEQLLGISLPKNEEENK